MKKLASDKDYFYFSIKPTYQTPDEIIKDADKKMYCAKKEMDRYRTEGNLRVVL